MRRWSSGAPCRRPRRAGPGVRGGRPGPLLPPPRVPPPIDRPGSARVFVPLETTEVKGALADGVQYTFWTFGGTVPGPFVRVRVGDLVQIRLKNAAKSMPPALDRPPCGDRPGRRRGGHPARTRPGPGAFEFKALNPGLYVYHCATPSVPEHIANGMYGLILVEPEKGLTEVDREYYVVQGEFYTKGKTLARGAPGVRPAKLPRAARVRGLQRHDRSAPGRERAQGQRRRDRAHSSSAMAART